MFPDGTKQEDLKTFTYADYISVESKLVEARGDQVKEIKSGITEDLNRTLFSIGSFEFKMVYIIGTMTVLITIPMLIWVMECFLRLLNER